MEEATVADGHLEIGWYYAEEDARSYRFANLWYRGRNYSVETLFMTPRGLKRKARRMVAAMKKAQVEWSEDL